MRYEPTPSELLYLDSMDDDERLHYFITRTMETEEVWRLCDVDGWVTREKEGAVIMPLWPYEGLAEAAACPGEAADAVSLEHFVFHELAGLQDEGIRMEVFPGNPAGKGEGVKMDAAMLLRIFDGKMEQEQYFIEG